MARPNNKGCDYFPVDVDMETDDKMISIEMQHGLEGYAVVMRVLAAVYRVGYCYRWDTAARTNFAYKLRIELTKLDAIINTALDAKFFDRDLLDRAGVLSSKGIQRRYLAIKKRKKDQLIKPELDLLCGEQEETDAASAGVMRDYAAQSKVKKSKVKESKDQEDRAQARESRRDQVKAVFESRSGIWLETLPTNALKRWIKFRSELKKPLTASSLTQILENYREKIPNFCESVDFTIEKGWQGLRHPSESGGRAAKMPDQKSKIETAAEFLARRTAARSAEQAKAEVFTNGN